MIGRRVVFVVVVAMLCVATASASIQSGAPVVEVTPVGPCPGDQSRCLAVAGRTAPHLLLWPESITATRRRLLAARGTMRFAVTEAALLDHATAAEGDASYFIVWRHASLSEVSGAEVSAGGAVGPVVHLDERAVADPPAAVVWNGLEFAVALRSSIVFIPRGGKPRTERLATENRNTPLGAVAAVSGTSLLVLRQFITPRYSGGMWQPWSTGGDLVATANVIGSSVGPAHPVIDATRGTHALSVAAGGDGFLAAWKSRDTVYAQRLDQSGGRVGSARAVRVLREEGGITSIAATRDGWLLLWDDEDRSGNPVVYAAELDANGALAGAVVTLVTGGRSPSVVKTGEDRFKVYYRTGSAIESRAVAAGSATLGPPRRRAVR